MSFTMQDLRLRCSWAGLADGVADQLVDHYGLERLHELTEAVWLVGLHLHTRKALPEGNTLGQRARSAAAVMPDAAKQTTSDWRELP